MGGILSFVMDLCTLVRGTIALFGAMYLCSNIVIPCMKTLLTEIPKEFNNWQEYQEQQNELLRLEKQVEMLKRKKKKWIFKQQKSSQNRKKAQLSGDRVSDHGQVQSRPSSAVQSCVDSETKNNILTDSSQQRKEFLSHAEKDHSITQPM